MIKYIRALFTAGIILILTYPIMVINALRMKKNRLNKISWNYSFTRFICKTCNFGLGAKYQIENREVLNQVDGNIVLICNHQSDYDILALISIIKKQFSPLAKKEVRKQLFLGKLSYALDTEYLDRENLRNQVKTIKNCIEKVKSGRMMLVFPEGTRTRDKNQELLEFKPGAFKIATDAKATIIPIVLDGTYTIITPKFPVRKTKARFRFLNPITPEEYQDKSNVELSDYIRELMNNNLIELKSKR